jgi:ABC-type Mn2+/Zn2+ transport system ATPase subunit
MLICIILEGIIVDSHMRVYNELVSDGLIIDVPTTSIDPEKIVAPANELALSLRRLKNENVFFILLSLFQLVLGIDAVMYIHHTYIYMLNIDDLISSHRLLDKV